MRTRRPGLSVVLTLAVLAALASRALAAEPEPEPGGDPLAAFGTFVGGGLDADVAWPERWRAYQKAKPDLDREREPIVAARRAFERQERLGPAELTDEERESAARHDPAVWKEFVRYQTALADWIRRDRMPLGGWVMGIFAALLLWGGFSVCVRIANQSDKSLQEPPPDEVTWPPRPES